MSTVSSILKHVHKGTIENAYTILNGEYEVILMLIFWRHQN